MPQTKRPLKQVFDPQIGDVVAEYETTSDRVRYKLSTYLEWCFCELCGQATEFAIASTEKARGVYKSNGTEIFLSKEICEQAEKMANAIAKRYELASTGRSLENPVHLILEYCGIDGFRRLMSEELRDRDDVTEAGKLSIEQFRLQVEGRIRMALWEKRGDFSGRRAYKSPNRKPTQKPSRAGEPSRFYCERHNQRRSVESRRTYQRDLSLAGQYYDLIEQIWREGAGELPGWDIEAHAHVRQEAYRLLQESKPRLRRPPAGMIDTLLGEGISNQSEIARRLGVSRQAVSAAIKRRAGSASEH